MSEQIEGLRIGDLRLSMEKLGEMRERNKELSKEHDRLIEAKHEIEAMYNRERGAAVLMSSKFGTLLMLGALVLIVANQFVEKDLVGFVLGFAVSAIYAEISAARKMADACITRVMNCETSVALVSLSMTRGELTRSLAHEEAVRNLTRMQEEKA